MLSKNFRLMDSLKVKYNIHYDTDWNPEAMIIDFESHDEYLNQITKSKIKFDSLSKLNSSIKTAVQRKNQQQSQILFWALIVLLPFRYWIYVVIWAIKNYKIKN